MARTVLLTLGRRPNDLEVARSFARAGWRAVVAEPIGWHLTRMSRAVVRSCRVTASNTDPSRCLGEMGEVVARAGVDLFVPVSEEAMHVAAIKAQPPAGVRLYGMGQRKLLGLHDKLDLARVAAGYGLDVPETSRGDEPEAADLAASRDFVIKPLFSCFGIGRAHTATRQPHC